MSDECQKLLDDCIGGETFGWENFVDQFLPQISRVAEFSLAEHGRNPDDGELKRRLVAHIFESISADNFLVLRQYNSESELPTYLTVVAQRHASAYLASDASRSDASPPDASPPDASPPDASPPDASRSDGVSDDRDSGASPSG